MADNNNREKDAFDAMFEYVDSHPDANIDEIASHLVDNGYANNVESVNKFFLAMGVNEE